MSPRKPVRQVSKVPFKVSPAFFPLLLSFSAPEPVGKEKEGF